MLAIVGVYIFLGNLFATGIGGDFNLALVLMGVSRVLRYALSATGLVLMSCFMFFVGTELLCWAPHEFSHAKAVISTTVAPWLVGTSLTVAVYWPLPAFLIGPTLLGSVFWAFAVLGAALGRATPRSGAAAPPINWPDLVITIAALVMVRLLVNGVRLVPSRF
jgi:hypothetical protein